MKANGIVAAFAVGSALSLGPSMATAPANGDPAADLTVGRTIDHNPLSDYEGYCTWGAQEQIHAHTGYYIKALTGNAETWVNQAEAAGWTVVGDAEPHSVAVFSGRAITITEMNSGYGATAANGYHTSGFHEFDTRTVEAVPGISYILIP
jgi:surface antigen